MKICFFDSPIPVPLERWEQEEALKAPLNSSPVKVKPGGVRKVWKGFVRKIDSLNLHHEATHDDSSRLRAAYWFPF